MVLIGMLCEALIGHRMGPWVRIDMPEAPRARFERSKCRVCRQGYVRPQPLREWSMFGSEFD